MRVLVTGAEGFIGSHLVERLLSSDYSVKATYQYNSFGHRGWLDQIPRGQGDLEAVPLDVRDYGAVVDEVKDCDAVIHLAALIAVPYSFTAPISYAQTNIMGTLNVLEACRTLRTNRVVITSTSEVFGTPDELPLSENSPLRPFSPYAATKIAADQLSLSYWRAFDLNVTIVRPFNTFGPRQSARALIPTLILQLLKGPDVEIGRTDTSRDLLYVKDTVEGFVSILETGTYAGEVFHLGTGSQRTVLAVATELGEILGVEPRFKTAEERLRPETSEVMQLLADHRKITAATGWIPKSADPMFFRTALKETIDFYRDHTHALSMYRKDYEN